MERQRGIKEDAKEGKILWRKIGGGSAILKINGVRRRIKPGEVFLASPEEIPPSVRDIIKPVDDDALIEVTKAPEEQIEVVKPRYTLQSRGKNKSWWNVVDEQGKIINERALKREEAEQLKAELER